MLIADMLTIFVLINLFILNKKCASFNAFKHVRRAFSSMMPLDVRIPDFTSKNEDSEVDRSDMQCKSIVGYSVSNHESSKIGFNDYVHLIQSNLNNHKSGNVLKSGLLGNPILPNCNGLSLARDFGNFRLGNVVLLIYLFEPLKKFILNYSEDGEVPKSVDVFKKLLKPNNSVVPNFSLEMFWDLLELYNQNSEVDSPYVIQMINHYNYTESNIVALAFPDFRYLYFKHGNNWYGFNGLGSVVILKRQPRMTTGLALLYNNFQ